MKKNVKIVLLAAAVLILAGCSKEAAKGDQDADTRKEQQTASGQSGNKEADASDKQSGGEVKDRAEDTKTPVRVASLKGPTSMGLVKMMKDAKEDQSANAYEFQLFAAADEMVPLIVKGDVDIVAVPANLASVLNKKMEGELAVININTLGVLYVVENGTSIQSFADLKGKTILTTGKGTIPEYTIRYLLEANGLSENDVKLEFKSEPSEVAALLDTEEEVVSILPEPFVTVAAMNNPSIRVAMDLTQVWDQSDSAGGSTLVTGVTVVRKEFLENHPEAVLKFQEEHKASAAFTASDIGTASALIEEFGIVKAPVAKKALPACNITFISGEEMKTKLGGYLSALLEQNPESVGGALPDDSFYYLGQ